jgi:hypothetical protein
MPSHSTIDPIAMRAMRSAASRVLPAAIATQVWRAAGGPSRYQAWPAPQCGQATEVETSAWKT